jgi:hypothetical protein
MLVLGDIRRKACTLPLGGTKSQFSRLYQAQTFRFPIHHGDLGGALLCCLNLFSGSYGLPGVLFLSILSEYYVERLPQSS